MKRIAAVAISGGIDSLLAAYLLKQNGWDVIGIHFLTGYETYFPSYDDSFITKDGKENRANNHSAVNDSIKHGMADIADQLGIEVKIVDISVEFKAKVIDYFTKSYLQGMTPNPCILCNSLIKFGTLLNIAGDLGATCLATGHYAGIRKDGKGRFHLLKGSDRVKDQSYFLARITQKQLSAACFPLGELAKPEVIRLGNEKGLKPFVKDESQDICFIRDKTYGMFLEKQSGFKAAPGLIENISGSVLGEHKGLHGFTIGQRRGINCPAQEPYYVIRKDIESNKLIVGFKKDLLSPFVRVADINWINKKPASEVRIQTRIRGRHAPVLSTLFPIDGDSAVIRFDSPQFAVTPGQGAVFYLGNEVLGGGWIQS